MMKGRDLARCIVGDRCHGNRPGYCVCGVLLAFHGAQHPHTTETCTGYVRRVPQKQRRAKGSDDGQD